MKDSAGLMMKVECCCIGAAHAQVLFILIFFTFWHIIIKCSESLQRGRIHTSVSNKEITTRFR